MLRHCVTIMTFPHLLLNSGSISPVYKSDEMKILNVSFSWLEIEPTTCRVYSQPCAPAPLCHDGPPEYNKTFSCSIFHINIVVVKWFTLSRSARSAVVIHVKLQDILTWSVIWLCLIFINYKRSLAVSPACSTLLIIFSFFELDAVTSCIAR